ncbi:TlpA family protein disulfide reductase [Sphingomonas yunnanensis]|uniref:TlpA family protein disulfide reductase n=1 Tax=Sphingomonas yunnanensis TaxID=310400 RepID=UPI001CA62453|nr:TlpA disulfide reductase family protein [Sphingomonas yunnanensis]MBY9064006.1 TlpA family protein disulfide reductase [Sphingomonas yunnanensis]
MRHLLLYALAGALMATPAAARDLKLGQPAPPIELTLVDGRTTTLAEHRGEVVLLNFWATWCVPCRAELPLLDGYYRRARQHGLSVFAVATDGSAPLRQLKPVFAAMAIPAVRRIKGISAEMPAVPTNYIIDRAGIVRYAKAAALDLDDLNRELIPLLNEPAPKD